MSTSNAKTNFIKFYEMLAQVQFAQRPGTVFIPLLLLACIICPDLQFDAKIFAQSTSNDKTFKKDFGKSLKKYGLPNDTIKAQDKDTPADEETIRVKTNLVTSDILVVNKKGNVVLGLKKNDFVITENGKTQNVEVFSSAEDQIIPRSIILIIDYSTSLFPFIKNSVQAAKVLIDKLGSQDRMAIVTDDVKLLVDFTNDKTLLKNKLDSLETKTLLRHGGESKQFSALLAVLNELVAKTDIHPIIIFQTDGDELALLKPDADAIPLSKTTRYSATRFGGERKFGFSDLKESIKKSRVTIYSIIPGLRFIGLPRGEQLTRANSILTNLIGNMQPSKDKNFIANEASRYQSVEVETRVATQSALFEVAKLSGGYADFIEKPEDVENVYSTMFTVINNRYVIGYYPADQAQTQKEHHFKIEVRGHPEYLIVGRESYVY